MDWTGCLQFTLQRSVYDLQGPMFTRTVDMHSHLDFRLIPDSVMFWLSNVRLPQSAHLPDAGVTSLRVVGTQGA